jgi:hypothetical protein
MPIVKGRDKYGTFFRWGHQKKYYVKEFGLVGAYKKATKQAQAIYASGYRKKNQIGGDFNKRKFSLFDTDDIQLTDQILQFIRQAYDGEKIIDVVWYKLLLDNFDTVCISNLDIYQKLFDDFDTKIINQLLYMFDNIINIFFNI